jgi:alpha-tubulin suppressor-like RCC1 family protein
VFGTFFGDDEFADALGPVTVGEAAEAIELGPDHSCALVAGGAARCWGYGFNGALGYGNTQTIGDDEFPDVAGIVDIGASATQLALGSSHTCAVTTDGRVRCWGAPGVAGDPDLFALGEIIGDDELPSSVGDIDVGGVAIEIGAGYGHTCVILDTGAVRCWGASQWGQTGIPFLAFPPFIGDLETPASASDVDYF